MTLPFPRMKYDDAMALITGSDSQIMRFDVVSGLDRSCQGVDF